MSENAGPNDLGIQVKLLRKANDITQKQLAKKVEMSRVQISRIESGEHIPTMPNMIKICTALNARLAIVLDANVINEKVEAKNGTTENALFGESAGN